MTPIPARYTFKIRAYETDAQNHLKISTVFNFMQVAAGLNANQLGFGYDQLTPKKYFWILSRVILDWHGNVSFDEEIILETWPKGVEKLFATRDFKFYSGKGDCIGKATTAWLLMDANTGRPVMLNSGMFNLPAYNIPPAIDELPGKISEPATVESSSKRKAAYSDIDVNQHVNNAKYIEYIFDALPGNEFMDLRNCRVQINYLKEVKMGETISLHYARAGSNENNFLVMATNADEQKVFQSQLIFKPE
jgi:acyl-ACP thioesterase